MLSRPTSSSQAPVNEVLLALTPKYNSKPHRVRIEQAVRDENVFVVLLKTIEMTRSGQKVTLVDYLFVSGETTFLQMCSEITHFNLPAISSNDKFYWERDHCVKLLRVEDLARVAVTRIFPANEVVVLVIPLSSRLAKNPLALLAHYDATRDSESLHNSCACSSE